MGMYLNALSAKQNALQGILLKTENVKNVQSQISGGIMIAIVSAQIILTNIQMNKEMLSAKLNVLQVGFLIKMGNAKSV